MTNKMQAAWNRPRAKPIRHCICEKRR